MTRAWLVFLLGVAIPVAVRSEEAFPVSGDARVEIPETVFEKKADLKPVGDHLRVASYNVENFVDGVNDDTNQTVELSKSHARLVAALVDEIDADMAMFIEIENDTALQMINQSLKKPYPAGYITRLSGDEPDDQKLNLAVLTRVPFAEVRDINFSSMQGPGRPLRGVLRVQVDLGEKHRLAAYLVHLKSNYGYKWRNLYQRRHAMQIVYKDARALRQSQTNVVWELMLLGDMNVDPDLPQFSKDWSLAGLRGWTDLWRGRPIEERTTIPSRHGDPALEFPAACFDRILVAADLTNFPWCVSDPKVLQKGTNTRDSHVLPGEDEHASDHYPIFVDILRDAPAGK